MNISIKIIVIVFCSCYFTWFLLIFLIVDHILDPNNDHTVAAVKELVAGEPVVGLVRKKNVKAEIKRKQGRRKDPEEKTKSSITTKVGR